MRSNPWRSRGRFTAETPSRTRTEFQRDRDRVIHSTAFRRLRDKTQVFLVDEGDHYRTRLTHTIEVAQIARALARALRLDEDLAEALALAHDLGHPPFGHAGERALDAAMASHGGFDHNAQSLAVVTRLERRYPDFDGLNLTWETLEGLVKHNGPILDRGGRTIGAFAGRNIPAAISDYAATHDLWLWSHAGPEAQAAAIADDIAYDAHDIDDGLRAGLLTFESLGQVETTGRMLREIDAAYPGLSAQRKGYELTRRLITTMIEDVIAESFGRLDALGARSADDIRASGNAGRRFLGRHGRRRPGHQEHASGRGLPASPGDGRDGRGGEGGRPPLRSATPPIPPQCPRNGNPRPAGTTTGSPAGSLIFLPA